MYRTKLTAIIIAAGLVFLGAVAEASPFSMDDAIATALEENPDIKIATQSAVAEAYTLRGVKGGFLPRLSLDGSLRYLDSATKMSFGSSGDTGSFDMTDPAMADLFSTIPSDCVECTMSTLGLMGELLPSMMGMGGDDTVLQEQLNWSVSLAVTQPLTPLYTNWLGYKGQEKLVSNANLEVERQKKATRIGVIEAYYGWLSATLAEEVASASTELLEALVTKTTSFFDAELVQKKDLLDVEVQLASMLQGLDSAKMGAAIAKEGLALAMGGSVPVDATPIMPSADLGLQDGDLPTLSESIDEALQNRIELKQIDAQAGAAEYGNKVQWTQVFMPSLVGLFSYTHSEGSTMQNPDSWFVGLSMSWTLWDWGTTYHNAKSSDATVTKIALTKTKLESAIKLEVTQAWLALDNARKNLEVTDKTITKAQEALDLELARFDAQLTTTTEVLDAQTALTKAKMDHMTAVVSANLYKDKLLYALGR